MHTKAAFLPSMVLSSVLPGLFALALGLFVAVPAQAGGRQIITHEAEGTDVWQTEFDVRDLSPGTWNIIVNARDSAGNVGSSSAFNLIIDPMAGRPVTRIVYPASGQVIRGEVNIIGVTNAPFGIRQVFARVNQGEFVAIGDSEFWHLNIPVGGLPDGRHSVFVKAEDLDELEGSVARIDFLIDNEPPEIGLTSHEVGDFISGRVRIQGTVDDVHGIRALYLSRDGARFTPLNTSGRRRDTARGFQFNLDTREYEDGPLLYLLRAVNNTGHAVIEPILFFVNNVPPDLEILSPTPEEDAFGNVQVTGRLVSLAGITEFFYEWAGQRVDIPRLPGDPFWSVTVPLHGRTGNFRVTAIDPSGNVARQTIQFRDRRSARVPTVIIDYPDAGRAMILAYDQAIYGRISDGFLPFAIRLEWLEDDHRYRYITAQPGFRIDPQLIPQGRNTLALRAVDEDGMLGPAFSFRTEKEVPYEEVSMPGLSRIRIESHAGYWLPGPAAHPWVGNSVRVAGFVEGWSPGQTLAYRLGPSEDWPWRNITLSQEAVGGEEGTRPAGSFEVTIQLGALEEGHVPLEFRTARQGVGDFPLFRPMNRSTERPTMAFISPYREYGAIHGMVTTAGIVDSVVPIAEISYSVDGGYEFTPVEFPARRAGRAGFSFIADFSKLEDAGHRLVVRAVDRAGNVVQASPDIIFCNLDDIPILVLNSPQMNELVTRDMEISGLAYDDDGIAAVHWRVLRPLYPWETMEEVFARSQEYGFDLGFTREATERRFSIPLRLADLNDGFNILEIYPVDIFGTVGEVTRRILRVSHTSPITVAMEPAMDIWNSGNIMVRGTAFDLNGISEVLVSMDNGVSWQRANVVSTGEAAEEWGMNLWDISINTRAFADGTFAMLIRTVDGFGVNSYSSAIINIDNTSPELNIASPAEGIPVSSEVFVSGQVRDNMALRSVTIQVVNIEDPAVQETRVLAPNLVIMERFDVSDLPAGDYIVNINALDYAGNETIIVRNISIVRGGGASSVAIINPLPGIGHSGPVVVSGRVTGAIMPPTVRITLDDVRLADAPVDRFGVFRYELSEEGFGVLTSHFLRAYFITPEGYRIESPEHPLVVSAYGPVLVIDSHGDGDVITGRPWLRGRAFMPSEAFYVLDEETGEEIRHEGAVHRPNVVQLSFDNGRSFVDARGRDSWRFRLEAEYLPAGPMPVVVRAGFDDDNWAVRRIMLTVDTQAPIVTVGGPAENSFHRHEIMVFGSASDNYQLESVEISLRRGNRNLYEVPGFIEGLFVDVGFLGGLQWATGIGLTFFDDNVRLQFNVSRAPPGTRFEGTTLGGKLVANIWSANLRRWFGPDWEFWTTSVGLGANFAHFTMAPGEPSQWMGQFLAHWEIIKADLSYFAPNWRYFSTVSLYMEPGVWFAASDVTGVDEAWRTRFTIGFGLRFSLF
ncbi:MAG: hypothetical protein FWD88_00735 [Treponema sp.]|nr:hypothetical protein [Treponema sp.]